MAENLCQLKKKGGGNGKMSETVLWTNPSPNAQQSNQTITLSKSVSNYDVIRIYYKGYYTNSSADVKYIDFPIDFVTQAYVAEGHLQMVVAEYDSNGYTQGRVVRYTNATQFELTQSFRIGGTNNYNANNIITKISGLK